MRCNGKLVFSICRKCTEDYQQGRCIHSDRERSCMAHGSLMSGRRPWHRVMSFKQSMKYGSLTKSPSMIRSLKLAGCLLGTLIRFWEWSRERPVGQNGFKPNKIDTITFNSTKKRNELLIDYKRIKKNPGLRWLAKLMLNSFRENSVNVQIWHKQRTNRIPQCFFTSDQQRVKHVRFINDESIQLDWVYNEDFIAA